MTILSNLKKIFDPYFIGFVVIYFGNLFLASALNLYNTDEVFGILLIVGFLFSVVSYVITRKSKPIIGEVRYSKNEIYVLIALQIYISVALIFGNRIFFLYPVDLSKTKEVVTIFRKVLLFVVIPFLVYRQLFKFRLSDFGLSTNWKLIFNKNSVLVFIVISTMVLLLNYFGGSGAKPIRDGLYTSTQLLISVPVLFLWLFIEVGLVEEFFFRGLLQNRLSVFLNSNLGAICVTSLVFGIVHAPGMYLRAAGAIEGLGSSPSVLTVVSYCIAIQSVSGFFLGIIWSKTRNLWLLMAIHAMIDLLPNLPDFIKIWQI
jgi:uncharacterized protein